MKKLVCFDLDNTLIRSDRAHVVAFTEALKEHGLKVDKRKLTKLLYGLTAEVIVKKLFPRLDSMEAREIADRHDEIVAEKMYKLVKPFAGTIKMLKTLRRNYEIAIVSNCRHDELNSLLKGAGITRKMYNIAIGKDQVKHSKPYPDELFKAEKLLKHEAVCMVGDSIYDVIAARRAGVKAISVLTGRNTRKEFEKMRSDAIIKNIASVPCALSKILIKEL